MRHIVNVYHLIVNARRGWAISTLLRRRHLTAGGVSALRRISIQCKISRDRFLASAFFWNLWSQPQLMGICSAWLFVIQKKALA